MQANKTESALTVTLQNSSKPGRASVRKQKPATSGQPKKLTSLAEKRNQAKITKKAAVKEKKVGAKKLNKSVDETLLEIKAQIGADAEDIDNTDSFIQQVSEDEEKLQLSFKTPERAQMNAAKFFKAAPKQPLLGGNFDLIDNSSNNLDQDWVISQTRDREKLQELSSQKRQIRLQTLQTTFDKTALSNPSKLTELGGLVARLQTKLESFEVPNPCPEKYMKLHVKPEFAQSQLREDSELMEDLYKILPLTIDSLFDESKSTVCCQFDTLTDL